MTSVWNFDYTGNVQSFSLPQDGYYQLEVWGASGGSDSAGGRGGYGGYATGVYRGKASTTLYIVVAGRTYNGGGTGQFTGGGGATHIALDTGLLSTLSAHATDGRILIVAGGGASNDTIDNGGDGGGYIGGASSTNTGKGGTQTAGGDYGGTFGQGGSRPNAGAGGGGYYGGGGSTNANDYGGGGGSGYIGSSLLISLDNVVKHMAGYSVSTSTDANTKTISVSAVSSAATADTAKTGNGYARITFLKELESIDYLSFKYGRTRVRGAIRATG